MATVSLALGAHPSRLEPATRRRVLTAASELDHTPNRLAQSLRRQRTGTLVALVRAPESAFYTDLLEGAWQEASQRDYPPAVVDGQVPRPRHAALQFLHGGVADGILVANQVDELRAELLELSRRGTPVAAVLGSALEPAMPLVAVDGEEAAFTATRHLIEHGHRRVAHLTTLPASSGAAINQAVLLAIRNGNPPDVSAMPGKVPVQVAINEGWVSSTDDLTPNFDALGPVGDQILPRHRLPGPVAALLPAPGRLRPGHFPAHIAERASSPPPWPAARAAWP